MSIEDWRRRIDEIDQKLVELLNERSKWVQEIGRAKRAIGLPVYQPEREQEILRRVEEGNSGPLPNGALRRLFERILDEARSVERHVMSDAAQDPSTGLGSGVGSAEGGATGVRKAEISPASAGGPGGSDAAKTAQDPEGDKKK